MKKALATTTVVIALLLLAGGFFLWKAGKLPFMIGWATLSLSQIDYISNDPTVAGRAWTIAVVLNQQGQFGVAGSTPTKLEDVYDKVKSKEYLTVKVESFPQTCLYTIDNRGLVEKVYTIYLEKMAVPWYESSQKYIDKCKAYPNYFSYLKPAWANDVWCWRSTELGTHGVLKTPATIWSAKLTAETSDGKVESKELTSWGSQSGWLGANVHYSWVGDLVSPEECPKLGVPEVMWYKGQWITTKPGAYTNYVARAMDDFRNCRDVLKDLDNCHIYYNKWATATLTSEPLVFYNLEGKPIAQTTTGIGDIETGQVKLSVNKLLRFPMLILKIKADWVGVVVEVGKPKIISLTSTDFTTGSQGTLIATIQNIGDGLGSFNAYATCTAGFAQSGKSPDYLSLNPRQTNTQYIYISGICSVDMTGTCTLTVEDRNNPANKDSRSVSIKCKTICECTVAGEKSCRGNDIVRCDGCRWITEQSCEYGCFSEAGVIKCRTAERCYRDADCDDANPFTVDKCEDGRCKNIAQCGLENMRCGGLLDKPCCPGFVCDKESRVCVKKVEIDWRKVLMVLGGMVIVATMIMLWRRK